VLLALFRSTLFFVLCFDLPLTVGVTHAKAQNHARAIRFFQESIRVRKVCLTCAEEEGEAHAHDSHAWDISTSLVKLGVSLMTVKEHYDDADASFREALRIRRRMLLLFGSVSSKEDTSDNANIDIDKHATIDIDININWGVAQVLSHMGVLYFERGERFAACSALEEALLVQRDVAAHAFRQQDSSSRKSKGILLDQHAILTRITMAITTTTIANTLKNIGTVRRIRGQYPQAIDALEECLQVSELSNVL
jgi:tetratricopeptide (TPR) repeat protein